MTDDLQRYLDDEPILAKRPSLAQRAAKWSRRHKGLVASTTVTLFLALVGLAFSTALIWREKKLTDNALVQAQEQRELAQQKAQEAERVADEAQAIVDFLVNDMLGSAAPDKALGRKVTVVEILANAEKKIDTAFAKQPLVEAAVRNTMGVTFWELGEYEAAERHLIRAWQLRTHRLGAEHPDTLASMKSLALVLRSQGKLEEARKLDEQTLAAARRVLGDEHPNTLALMNNLANVLIDQGKLDEAFKLHEQTLEVRRRILGDEHPRTLSSIHNLAVVLKNQGKLQEAFKIYEQTLEVRRRVLGDEHSDTLKTMNNLANVLTDQGKLDEAFKLIEQTLEVRRRVLGEEHPHTQFSMHNLARIFWRQGEIATARKLLERTLELRRRILGDEHPDTLITMNGLAVVLDDHEEAQKLYEQTLEVQRRILGAAHPDTLVTQKNLGICYNKQAWRLIIPSDPTSSDLEQAAELLRKDLKLRPKASKAWQVLGWLHYRRGDWKGSVEALEKSMELQKRPKGGDPWQWFWLAMAHWELGQTGVGGRGSGASDLNLTSEEQARHKEEARRYYHQAVARMQQSEKRMQNKKLRRFRAEAEALMGIKKNESGDRSQDSKEGNRENENDKEPEN